MAAAPVAAVTTSDVRAMLVDWVNADRVANGLVAYRTWTALDGLAADRAARMADARTLSHAVAGGNVGDALDARGIPWSWYGETLGMSPATFGETSARQVFDAWLASDPHRNIVRSDVDNYVGIGVAQSVDGWTWVSLIATQSPDHTAPTVAATGLSRSGDDLTFRWRGSDPLLQTLTAGIRSYDVQLRRDGGSWRLVRDNTTSVSVTLRDRKRGHWFSLRVQAADRRGTLSAWTKPVRIWVP